MYALIFRHNWCTSPHYVVANYVALCLFITDVYLSYSFHGIFFK